jgi:hypothetical protein
MPAGLLGIGALPTAAQKGHIRLELLLLFIRRWLFEALMSQRGTGTAGTRARRALGVEGGSDAVSLNG